MTPTILAAGLLPATTFTIGGSSQQIAYVIGVNPVTVPQDGTHVLAVLLQIKSPSGLTIYENAGYAGGAFTSPDSLTGAYDLLFLTGTTTAESGIYLINIKARYTETVGPVVTLASKAYSSEKVCMSCLPAGELTSDLNCTKVLLNITDTTNYCLTGYDFTGVTREITATPPSGSNQPSPVVTTKQLLIDNGNAGNGVLWNGDYLAYLTATATYVKGSTTITQSVSASIETAVSCTNAICTINCLFSAMVEEYKDLLNSNPAMAQNMLPKIQGGSFFLQLAQNACACGLDARQYIDGFYFITGIKQGCSTCDAIVPTGAVSGADCGCGGSSGTGAPGQRGSQILFGSGAPSGGLGLNGDMYINNTNGDVYSKISGTWTLELNIKGATGAAGAAGATGAAGASGTTKLFNPNIAYTNDGSGASDFITRTIPNTALVTPGPSSGTTGGDTVDLQYEFATNTFISPLAAVLILINGTPFTIVFSPVAAYVVVKIRIVLISNTQVKIDGTYQYFNIGGGGLINEDVIPTILLSYTPATTMALKTDFSLLTAGQVVFNQLLALSYK